MNSLDKPQVSELDQQQNGHQQNGHGQYQVSDSEQQPQDTHEQRQDKSIVDIIQSWLVSFPSWNDIAQLRFLLYLKQIVKAAVSPRLLLFYILLALVIPQTGWVSPVPGRIPAAEEQGETSPPDVASTAEEQGETSPPEATENSQSQEDTSEEANASTSTLNDSPQCSQYAPTPDRQHTAVAMHEIPVKQPAVANQISIQAEKLGGCISGALQDIVDRTFEVDLNDAASGNKRYEVDISENGELEEIELPVLYSELKADVVKDAIAFYGCRVGSDSDIKIEFSQRGDFQASPHDHWQGSQIYYEIECTNAAGNPVPPFEVHSLYGIDSR